MHQKSTARQTQWLSLQSTRTQPISPLWSSFRACQEYGSIFAESKRILHDPKVQHNNGLSKEHGVWPNLADK